MGGLLNTCTYKRFMMMIKPTFVTD
jgi:hypothetical protein